MAPEDQAAGLDQAQDQPSPSTSELCETSLRSKPPPVVLLLRPPELTETEAQRNVQVTLRQRPPLHPQQRSGRSRWPGAMDLLQVGPSRMAEYSR